MGNPPNKQVKGFEFAWLCWALITQRFDVQSNLGASRNDPQSMEPPRLLLVLEKNFARLQWARLGCYAQTHQWLFGVGREVKLIPPSLGVCQSLKTAAKHFSWDKQAFFLLEDCCSPCSHLTGSLWQLLMAGAEALLVLISSSPTGSQMGDSETPKVTQDGISKALTPSRATFSINSSVSLLWQSFRLKEKVWGFNLN